MSILQSLKKTRDKSINLTAPKTEVLHGVIIRKLPIAKYIEVLRAADDIPALLLDAAFPNAKNFTDLASAIVSLDREAMLTIIGRLLTTVPEQLCKLLSQLLDIPQDRLLDPYCPDPLSLNEITEIISAFARVNDYSDFFGHVRLLKRKLEKSSAQSKQNTGSNAG